MKYFLLVLLVLPFSVSANELCFVCVGTLYVAPTKTSKELGDNQNESTFCFDSRTKNVTHLSRMHRGSSFKLVSRVPATDDSPGFLNWESTGSKSNTRFGEELKTFIEFVELQQRVQVVDKNSRGEPRIAFNGLCREVRRIP